MSGAHVASARIQKDLAELSMSRFRANGASTRIVLPEGSTSLKFEVTISMFSGYYRGGQFVFVLDIPTTYPYYAPIVRCSTPVFHPSISVRSGMVRLPILTDWRPVLTVNTVIFALQLLFLEPNCDEVLHEESCQESAYLLRNDPEKFKQRISLLFDGGFYFGMHFPRFLPRDGHDEFSGECDEVVRRSTDQTGSTNFRVQRSKLKRGWQCTDMTAGGSGNETGASHQGREDMRDDELDLGGGGGMEVDRVNGGGDVSSPSLFSMGGGGGQLNNRQAGSIFSKWTGGDRDRGGKRAGGVRRTGFQPDMDYSLGTSSFSTDDNNQTDDLLSRQLGKKMRVS